MSDPIANWLINESFVPVTRQRGINPRDYCSDAVCAKPPETVDIHELLHLVDRYTKDNNQAVISGDTGMLILSPGDLKEVRANLRARRPQKLSSQELEAQEIGSTR